MKHNKRPPVAKAGRGAGPTPLTGRDARLLDALKSTLSERQMQIVLARGLAALGSLGHKRLLGQLDANTAATVRGVLNGRFARGGRRPLQPGTEKLGEDWRSLWSEWDDCVAEAATEDGKYVCQDAHWEPPYLDSTSVMDDLEAIAKRMRPLLARVWDEGLDPDLSFAEVLESAGQNIGAGLEEIGIESVEPGQFGPETTT